MQSLVPVQVQGLTAGVSQIAVGATHACAILSGGVWCWGENSGGQLGNSSLIQSLIPVPVTGIVGGTTQISAAVKETCAVVSGSAYCWGDDSYQELGINGASGNACAGVCNTVPIQVTGLNSGVYGVASGYGFNFALTNSGAFAWGMNSSGDTGTNTSAILQYLIPTPLLNWP